MRFRALFASGLFVVTASAAFGQTAGMVSFQGLIRSTATGNPPITTPVSLEFRIFNADTGGAQVDMDGDGTVENTAAAPGAGTDTILVGPLTPNGGIVSTKFGPVSPKAFTGCTPGVAGCRWLEVTVVGSATPLSRLEMVTPPGAAEQVNKLNSGDPALKPTVNGNVGIGDGTPLELLHVGSGSGASGETIQIGAYSAVGELPSSGATLLGNNVKPANTPTNGMVFMGNQAAQPGGRAIRMEGGGGIQFHATGTGAVASSPFSGEVMRITDTGNVGIGTTSPSDALLSIHRTSSIPALALNTPDGSYSYMVFKSGGAQRGIVGYGRTGNIFSDQLDASMAVRSEGALQLGTGAGSDMTIGVNGNVGIGTSTPFTSLDIQGRANVGSGAVSNSFLSADTQLQVNTDAGTGSVLSLIQVGNSIAHIGSRPTDTNFYVTNAYDGSAIGTANRSITLDNAGNVGIGTTTPGTPLEVRGNPMAIRFGDSGGVGNLIAGSSYVGLATTDGNVRISTLQANGNVGIGTVTPAAKLHVAGDIQGATGIFGQFELISALPFVDFHWSGDSVTDFNARLINEGDRLLTLQFRPGATGALNVQGNILTNGGACCGSSDQRLKKNIRPLAQALGTILALRGVNFEWTAPEKIGGSPGTQTGMIAQEVEKVLPEWVMTDAKGYRYLNTTGFPALAVEAIREMKNENDALKSQVSALEDRLARLEKAIGDKSDRSANSEGQE